MRAPHASIYLQTTRRLASPPNYLRSPLYALAFTLVRSCFHVLHAIPILSLLHRVPATMYYPFNNDFSSTHHTSFTSSLADPKLKILRHLVFDFGPTTAQTQIPWALASCPFLGVLPLATPYYFVWCPGSFSTLINLHGCTSAYTCRRGTRGRSVWLP
jgi:hypothetical protein